MNNTDFTIFSLIPWVVLITSIWVLCDAIALKARPGGRKGTFDAGPLGWFLACLALWIIVFPAYLIVRDDYKKPLPAPPTPPESTTEKIKQLAELREQNLISEEEFQTKKSELLSRM